MKTSRYCAIYSILRTAAIFLVLLVFSLYPGCKEKSNPAKSDPLPSVTTHTVTFITVTSAWSGGTIDDDGGAEIIGRGVCWSTDPTPTIAHNVTDDGHGTGDFLSEIKGLAGGHTYHVRAYATTGSGTGYGETKTFSTPLLTDIDGNTYKTIKIGNQVWMAENLRVTRYRNGDLIPFVDDFLIWRDVTADAYCTYDDDSTYAAFYGFLYNQHAVNVSRNIAPEGWHVPSISEYNELITFLGGEDVAGGKMKATGTTYWNNPNTGASNSSGFSALSGGGRHENGLFHDIGTGAFFWSSSFLIILNTNDTRIQFGSHSAGSAYSVRCVSD